MGVQPASRPRLVDVLSLPEETPGGEVDVKVAKGTGVRPRERQVAEVPGGGTGQQDQRDGESESLRSKRPQAG